MKRLCIFIFYDKDGIADEYIFYLLKNIKVVAEDLIIIINGSIKVNYLFRMKKISSQVFVRENIGFDGGAYKDAFLSYVDGKQLASYDQIILMNDTFYGPFCGWDVVFKRMENISCDFWGLSRRKEGGTIPGVGKIPEHIHGYFIVCKRDMFLSTSFSEFWLHLKYPATYQEAIKDFEFEFSLFFKRAGFHYISYADVCGVKASEEQTVYMPNALPFIRNAGFPVVKKKHMNSPLNCVEVDELLNWLSANTAYDTSLIVDSLKRHQNFDLERFYNSHSRVFIYGYGEIAKRLHRYFKLKEWVCESFIVSRLESTLANITCERIVEITAVNFLEEDGVVLALGKKYQPEVLPLLKDKIAEKDIYIVE